MVCHGIGIGGGDCFIIELAFSPVVMGDVMKGFLPSPQIFTDPECLYVAIGIIGATVMPHNLFLHSFIVQSRCHTWRSERPYAVENNHQQQQHQQQQQQSVDDNETLFLADDMDDDIEKTEEHEAIYMMSSFNNNDTATTPLTHSSSSTSINNNYNNNQERNMTELRQQLATHVDTNLHYSFVDLVVALSFAFFINTAILVVASANFYSHDETILSDLFDAHSLLRDYIGPMAAFVFAIALLCAGQSSTLTATLAGQVVMSGFLGGITTRPWLRRLVTRGIAIVPAMMAAIWAGRSGLSQMLVASQVALSIQLPFAVVPLVYFTASPHIMKLDLLQSSSSNKKNVSASSSSSSPSWFSSFLASIGFSRQRQQQQHDEDDVPFLQHSDMDDDDDDDDGTCMTQLDSSTTRQEQHDEWPVPLTYANSPLINVIACLVAALLIGLNIYLVISTIVS
ncbi:unnamed protein product [Absidia cylindrospora]